MKNYIWYVGLAAVSFLPVPFVLYKKRKTYPVSTMMIYYLFATGMTWIAEFTVLGMFNSYEYRTGLYTSPWAQNLMGHLFLNATMYPAAGLIMVTCSLKYRWTALVAAIFVAIEYIYVKLGLYAHYWWRYYMSVITVFIFIAISRRWFLKMIKPRRRSIRAVVFYFVAMFIIHIPSPLLLLYGRTSYTMEWIYQKVQDIYITSIIITFFYHLLESFLVVLVTCILKNPKWKIVPFIVSPAVQILFARTGIMVVKNGWKPVYTILIYVVFIAAFMFVEKNTLKMSTEES